MIFQIVNIEILLTRKVEMIEHEVNLDLVL